MLNVHSIPKMKKQYILSGFILPVILTLGYTFNIQELDSELLSPSEEIICQADPEEAFNIMMDVITHQRCMNCHPSGDRPRQGEDSHIHTQGVKRGKENKGTVFFKCQTCHKEKNNGGAGIPGAVDWQLAPLSMAWEGLSRNEIARVILDKSKNGNRSIDDIVDHLATNELVNWAFEPGVDPHGVPREVPPVTKDIFLKAVKDWAEAGAIIPKE